MTKISSERKNLSRLSGEFLVASRLTQRGYMVALQWGTTIGYDILVFDKAGNSAFLEIKTSASYSRRWVLQSKYANPDRDQIPLSRRFICCVDMAGEKAVPDVYVFPARVVADGLHYYFSSKFPNSQSYHLSLDFKPQHKTKEECVHTVGEFVNANNYLENYTIIGIEPVTL